MDRRYSWKRTEEIEIDLADLLKRLCMRWKQAAVCALAAALVLGGYGWLKDRGSTPAGGPDLAETEVLTEAEEQGVEAAVQLESEIRELETYLDNSMLMQTDPYHKSMVILLYRIDRAKSRELPAITESYLNFTLNGGAADALGASGKSWKMDQSYMAELIAAYQKTYNFPYQVAIDKDSSESLESLFYVEITGKNSRSAEKMALDMQEVLKEYSAKAKETAGNHRLTLISSSESITADSALQTQQHDKKALLSSNKTNLKAMTDAFSRKQMAAYQDAAGLKDEDGQESEESLEAAVSEENSRSIIKYVLFGLIGGVSGYCGVYLCWYLFCDTVKSLEEMKRLYAFPVYGGIMLEDGNRKSTRFLPGISEDGGKCGKAQVLNRIRILCRKQEMTGLYAVSDFTFTDRERDCLESIAKQLKEWGISLAVAENAIADTAVWDSLSETGNVLMVCRIGTTTHRMIDEAMDFYLENGIAVAGAAVFLQSGRKKNRTWL